MKRATLLSILLSGLLLLTMTSLQAQSNVDDVHLFQSYFYDG